MATIGQKQQRNIKKIESDSITWVNLPEPTAEEIEHVRQVYRLHTLPEDTLSKIQLPRVDDYGDYLFLTLHFPVCDLEKKLFTASEVDFFVGRNYLITSHHGDLQPLNKLFSDCASNGTVCSQLMGHSPGYLLYQIIFFLVDYCFRILHGLIDSVDNMETVLFDAKGVDRTKTLSNLRRLSEIRGDILDCRRIVRPQIEALGLLDQTYHRFLKVDPDVYFGDLANRMRRVWVELDELKETVEGLHDTNATLTSVHTNEVIRLLTFIFTLTLPATLIMNFFGMKVPLPLEETSFAPYLTLGIVTVCTVGLLVLLHIRRWI